MSDAHFEADEKQADKEVGQLNEDGGFGRLHLSIRSSADVLFPHSEKLATSPSITCAKNFSCDPASRAKL